MDTLIAAGLALGSGALFLVDLLPRWSVIAHRRALRRWRGEGRAGL